MKKTKKILTVVALSTLIPMTIQGKILATNESEEMKNGGIAPELKILESQSVGKDGVYSKLVLETTDVDGDLAYYLINGYAQSTIPEENGHKNSRTFIGGHIKEGENTIKVFDKAGNCSNEIKFIADYTKPQKNQLRIIGGSYNEATKTRYAKENDIINVYVGFTEELGTAPKLKINDSIELNMNYYQAQGFYGANFKVDEAMAEGKIKVEIYGYADKSGNIGETLTNEDMTLESQSKVIVDKTAPQRVYSTIRAKQGVTEIVKNGEIYYYVKNGSKFEFAISFNEELKQNPIAVIGNKEIELKINEKVKNNESKYLYEGTLEINESETELPEGTLAIKVKNIIDLSGNEATGETETTQTPTSNHRSLIYDRTAPKITVKENTDKETFTIKNKDGQTYSKISFKLYDAQKIAKIVINGQEKPLTQDTYGDHNFVTIGSNYGVEGRNEITLYDIAGNTTTYEFYLENEKEEDNNQKPTEGDENKKPTEGDHNKHHCKNICCYIKHKICIMKKIVSSIFGRRI